MPTNSLKSCRNFLSQAYQSALGYSISDAAAAFASIKREPVWRSVCSKDLTTQAGADEPDAAGLLLDPEIGTVLYLLPFDEESELRSHVLCALGLRSKLSHERFFSEGQNENTDPNGAWRVVLYWLVKGADTKQRWISQMTTLRRETAFSEELSFDAIFYSGADITSELENHGFPRLLLATREVLKKREPDEVIRWMSANERVAEALKGFVANFRTPEQRELAAEVVRAMNTFGESQPVERVIDPPETPANLRSISIRNFRNLRIFDLDFGPSDVSARVIHGPNGTGKSSVCEAISLMLFGSSPRYRNFSQRDLESDIVASDRRSNYIERYLSPIERQELLPSVSINNADLGPLAIATPDRVDEAELLMSGTILTQDTSQEFARLQSNELGARVLRGYSELADHVEEVVISRVTQAKTARQEFLRTLQISASIKRIDTAFERIARRELDQLAPSFPQHLVSWLEQVCSLNRGHVPAQLPALWRTWGGDTARSELSRSNAKAIDQEKIKRELKSWLEQYNDLVAETGRVLSAIRSKVTWLLSDMTDPVGRLALWADWLERRADSHSSNDREVESLTGKLHELQQVHHQLTGKGKEVRARLDHLAQADAFVSGWTQTHPNECPTCGADHGSAGGLRQVMQSLRLALSEERDRLREDFARGNSQIEGLQKQLSEMGQSQCPLSVEEQSRLTDMFQWLIPQKTQFSLWISNRGQRDDLLREVLIFSDLPTPPEAVDTNALSGQITQETLSGFRNAERVFEGPDNWSPVAEKLNQILADIVNQHLPGTLQRLWSELSMNLTAAPWLLPERPCFQVVSRKGTKQSSIQVKERLARYILNQAEIHTLGLAWFFTRYLTHGRFFNSCMVMDDPAQEMDQTSFRDMCRLCETWVRLHRVYHLPLRLVLLLNQESRALAAARATNGVLVVLGWTGEQESAPPAISMGNGAAFAPTPAQFFSVAS